MVGIAGDFSIGATKSGIEVDPGCRYLAGPAQLERIWRDLWTIENRLHYVRDGTFGDDRCQIHTGTAAQALTVTRNAVISTLRFHGWSNLGAATRCYAAHPQRILRLIGATIL